MRLKKCYKKKFTDSLKVCFIHCLSNRFVSRINAYAFPELETFIDTAQVPSLALYTQKLAHAKQRMESINAILQRIQDRITRIEKNFVKKSAAVNFQY